MSSNEEDTSLAKPKPAKLKKAKKVKKAPPPPSIVLKGLQSVAALRSYDMLQNPKESGVGDIAVDKQETVMFTLFHFDFSFLKSKY